MAGGVRGNVGKKKTFSTRMGVNPTSGGGGWGAFNL